MRYSGFSLLLGEPVAEKQILEQTQKLKESIEKQSKLWLFVGTHGFCL